MKLILKDGTEFECASLYQNHTINHTEEEYYQDGCSIKFDLPEHPQELYNSLKEKFTEDNISNITVVTTFGGVDIQTTYSFSKVVTLALSLRDGIGLIEAYLI